MPAPTHEGPGVGLPGPDAARAQTRARAAVTEFMSQACSVFSRVCPKFQCEPGPINNSRSAQEELEQRGKDRHFLRTKKELIFYFSERLGEQSK